MVAAAEEILEYARSQFDVTGVSELDGQRLLILGLESTSERDLDDFGYRGKAYCMFGFEEHVVPRLNNLLGFISQQGFDTQPLERYGYAPWGEVHLKDLAIRAGIAQRGKSSVMLHPIYGNRLRFIGVRTDAPLTLPEPREDTGFPLCRDCTICLDICPVKVLEPYRMTDPAICLSNYVNLDKCGRSILCDECLKVCPANRL